MNRIFRILGNLRHDVRGITAIEYAVLAGGVSVALIAVFSSTGIFDNLQTKLESIIEGIPSSSASASK